MVSLLTVWIQILSGTQKQTAVLISDEDDFGDSLIDLCISSGFNRLKGAVCRI